MDDKNIQYLRKCIDENKLSHAFLVEAENFEEVINKIVGLFIDTGIIYNQKDVNNNISVRVVRPEDNSIDKDAILDLQSFLVTTSFDDKYKVYFLVGAELMNNYAANKLLKTLEEPMVKSVGFLLCNDASLIIPTISSRCQKLSFLSLNDRKNEIDLAILDELCKFLSMNFEEYISFKQKISKYDKIKLINLFSAYADYLKKNNSSFFINVSNFLDSISMNGNFDLQFDRLYFERSKD